jgi:2Fe-2S ferredoxin
MPKMIFVERDGTRREVDAPLGLSVLEVAHKHGVDIMLDLAFGLQATSRLGCQIVMTPALDGLVVKLPAATRNAGK